MRTLIVGLVCLAWAAMGVAPARTQTLSPDAFAQEIAQAVRKAVPSAKVTISDELELSITYANRQNVILALTNAYIRYKADPQGLRSLIELHVSRLATPPTARAELDPATIVPVIKSKQWLHDLYAGFKAKNVQQEQLVETFVGDLVIAYAEDQPNRLRYLTTRDYVGDRKGLRDLAVTNYRRVLPQIEMQAFNEHVSVVSAGDDYTSGLLLIDEVWTSGQIKVRGDIVVAIPTRDAIFVTGSRSTTIRNFRALVADMMAKGPNPISDALFVYRNNRFVPFTGN